MGIMGSIKNLIAFNIPYLNAKITMMQHSWKMREQNSYYDHDVIPINQMGTFEGDRSKTSGHSGYQDGDGIQLLESHAGDDAPTESIYSPAPENATDDGGETHGRAYRPEMHGRLHSPVRNAERPWFS